MKKLLMVFAAVVLCAQAGYCVGPAIETLKRLGGDEKVSAGLSGQPVPANVAESKTTASAKAVSAMGAFPGETPYEKLKGLFDRGIAATKRDVTGCYSGRVSGNRFPSVVSGAFLFGNRLSGGPALGDIVRVELYYAETPDYFDKIGPEELKIIQAKDPTIPLGFPSASGTLNRGGFKMTIQLRKTGEYLTMRYVLVNDYEKLYEEAYAYYFLDVTPKR